MDPVTTRRATPADADALAEIACRAYLPYVERMGGLRPAPLDADYAASVARDVVWVAVQDGQVAGYVVLVDEPAMTLLENVAVDPDRQGRGIGRLLIAAAEEHARTTGTHAVRLYTNAVMRENRRLYARLGYAEVSQRSEDAFHRVFLEKRLDRSSPPER
jgi:ribosomal protein S18 acetylase RimI-like enzyme